MTPRTVIMLAFAALISTIGAVVAYRANNVFVPLAGVGEKVLPGLEARLNDVRRIEVTQGLKKLVLVEKDGVWQVEKTGFPVGADKVKQALVGLSGLTKLQAKTSNPKKYLLISVDAPGQKGGRGRQFTLRDKDGKKIAGLITGKTVIGKEGPGRDAQYVRVVGDETSWLASGAVVADTSLTSWVDPRFLSLDVDSIISGQLTHKDGEVVAVRRTGADANGSSTFELLNVPAGRKSQSSTFVKFAATDFANMDLLDVRKATGSKDVYSTAIIETKDGLKLKEELIYEKPNAWVRVSVLAKGKNTKLADKIIVRTKGWEFRISKSDRSAFERRNKDLLEKQK